MASVSEPAKRVSVIRITRTPNLVRGRSTVSVADGPIETTVTSSDNCSAHSIADASKGFISPLMTFTHTSTVNIPLVDYTGKIKINGAKAELIEGGEAKTVNISGDTFPVELEKFQSAVFKITPNEAVDFSGVKGTRFRDLQHHVWAREAIIEMDDKGIVNDLSAVAFAPGRNITRGDFAMFLVRALGLTGSGAKVSFDDVYTNREYAEAIAIGKEEGILNGVGDNKFNPDAEISRQDMMTIISRGMALSGDSDLAAFSDSSEIADYALSHVKAMIASGLIKGNADGTINPRGNTTRAEAAVIMQRIINRYM